MSSLAPVATYFTGAQGPMYKRDDTNGTLRWYIYDGLGSVLAEVDPSGNVTAGRKYDVYGLVRSGQAGISKHKFVGKLGHPSEDETGLVYMRARYMDPGIGKFISEDQAQDGDNWYVYCENDPVNFFDISGAGRERIFESNGFYIDLDSAHIPGGQQHIHYGDRSGKWGAINFDGSAREGVPKKGLTGKMKKGLRARFGTGAFDSVTASFETDPLSVIAILLDIAGMSDEAAEVDRINGMG